VRNLRSSAVFLILFILSAIIIPLILYSNLIGAGFSQINAWLIVIAVSEIALWLGKRLTRSEVFLIQVLLPIVTGQALLFYNILYYSYIVWSPFSREFGFAKITWWFPQEPLIALGVRSFIQPIFAPIVAIFITTSIISTVSGLALGYIGYELLVVKEKLDFPMQVAVADGLSAVVGEDPAKVRFFSMSAIIGILYATLATLIPILAMRQVPALLPIFTYDLTLVIEHFLPGATLGIDFNLLTFSSGLVIPLKRALCLLIGSLLVYAIGNHLLVVTGYWTGSPIGRWMPGSNIFYCIRWSSFNFWTSFNMGVALSAALIPLILKREVVKEVFSTIAQVTRGRGGYASRALLLFIALSFLNIVLLMLALPEFPVYLVACFMLLWPLVSTLVSASSIGASVYSFNIPYVKEGLIIASKYRGLDVWIYPMYLDPGGARYTANMKTAVLCGVKPGDYIKYTVLAVVMGIALSFVFTSILWYMHPIPSWNYPATAYNWQISAYNFLLNISWMSHGEIIKPHIILLGVIVGGIGYITAYIFKKEALFFSLVAGLSLAPSAALTTFIGSLVSSQLMSRVYKDKWREYVGSVTSGLTAGWGAVNSFASIIAFIQRGVWVLPY